MAIEDLNDIVLTARHFWVSKALFVAIELDLFTRLTNGPKSPSDLASEIGCDPEGMEALLAVLVSFEIITKFNNQFANTTMSERYLSLGKGTYIGHILKADHRSWEPWSRLGDQIRQGKTTGPSVLENLLIDPTDTHNFLMKMYYEGIEPIGKIVGAVDFSGVQKMIDLGGAPGSYSIAFAQKIAHLHSVVLDLPVPIEISKEMIETSGLSHRIDARVGDLLQDKFGEEYDLALLSKVLHLFDYEENALILRKTYACLRPGGQVIIHDWILDESRTFPPEAALFNLHIFLCTRSGRVYTEREIRSLLRKAGFEEVTTQPLSVESPLIASRNPFLFIARKAGGKETAIESGK